MPPKDNKKKGPVKSSNKSPLFARRNPARKVRTKSADADVTENVNCSERKQNKTDCENAMIDPDCVWNDEKCITAADANKRIIQLPLSGSNDTSGNADGTDNDLNESGAPTNTGQKERDDNMTQAQIEEAQKQAGEKLAADKEVTPTGTVTPPPTPPTPIPPTPIPSPQEYTVSFEGTYDEDAKTFSGSLKIDGKEYTITSNPSMSSGVSSSSSPETDDNIASIKKMLPTIPGITFNIQEV